MKVKLDPDLHEKLKKLDVRIRNRFKESILLFSKNPNASELNNHALKREYEGLRSIDVTSDYRAVYEEVKVGEDTIAYFSILGTHKELYG
jgi:addiction module RelE/StbE family toxin